MTATPTLGVVIVSARGGSDLDAALAAATWADVRAVLPTSPAPPASVRDVRMLADLADVVRIDATWALVLFEHERIAPDAVDGLRAALAEAPAGVAFALPVVSSLLDMDVRLRRPLVRLAPRATPLAVGGGLSLAFETRGLAVREIDVTIFRARGSTVDRAVELMGAEAGALAALVERLGPRRGVVRQSARAALRGFTARAARPPLGLGRWIVAVFEGYRVVVAYAKLWERRRDRVAVNR
jgi:hypothetical protein